MKQIKTIVAYKATEELIKNDNLSINSKWVLYKVRKALSPHYEFYTEESQKLFDSYETKVEGTLITFNSPELATEYQTKQKEIDDLEVTTEFTKETLKLSDIPSITVPQIEALEDFIEFVPE